MNVLLFDGGNTRFKWALVRHGRLGAQHATARDQLDAFIDWIARSPPIDRVVGVNVGGKPFERALRAVLRQAASPRPEFITSSSAAAGVRNAYANPALLGSDRWAAAVAAWHAGGCRRTVCAVSVGTALTLDLVDQEGRHRGGLIAPGPQLMRETLLGSTADIARRAALRDAKPPRRNSRLRLPPLATATQGAVDEGCLSAAAGFIDRTMGQLTRQLEMKPLLFITGGGSAPVVARLRSACRPTPDLVLRGVAAIAEVTIRRPA